MHISPFNRLILLILIACTPLPVWAQTTTIEKPSAPASPNSNLKPLVNLNGGTQSLSVSESQDTFRYTLGAGDNIKIEVFNVPELSGNQTIAPDGTINISLIGAVKLEGLGLDEANALLREKLNPFLVRNIVNISLISPRPLNIAIVGEVNRPGPRFLTYVGTTGLGSNAATLTRALESAAGITSRADISNIQISRRDGTLGRRIIKVNLQNLLEKGDISQDVRILDGDSILVPPLSQASASQPRTVSNSTFSPDTFTRFVGKQKHSTE